MKKSFPLNNVVKHLEVSAIPASYVPGKTEAKRVEKDRIKKTGIAAMILIGRLFISLKAIRKISAPNFTIWEWQTITFFLTAAISFHSFA